MSLEAGANVQSSFLGEMMEINSHSLPHRGPTSLRHLAEISAGLHDHRVVHRLGIKLSLYSESHTFLPVELVNAVCFINEV
jgi:hypothetical protein